MLDHKSQIAGVFSDLVLKLMLFLNTPKTDTFHICW